MIKYKNKIRFLFIFFVYLWQVLFVFIPIFILIYNGFSINKIIPMISWANKIGLLSIILRSFTNAFFVGIICLFLGYIVVNIILKQHKYIQMLCLILLCIPFLTNFLIHILAWIKILSNNGVIQKVINYFNLNIKYESILYSTKSTLIGFVHCYIPLMILPLYAALTKFDITLLKASYDLGASNLQTFFRILIPGIKKTIFMGYFLIFVPSCGEFIIPEILGGDKYMYCGSVLSHILLSSSSLTDYASFVTLIFIFSLSAAVYTIYIFLEKFIALLQRI
jgi:spermidine/putrescine transport system permease protein